MSTIKIKPRRIESVQKSSEPCILVDNQVYLPLKIETENDAMRACLHMMLKHSADMFVTICDIVAEEYKLDSTKMVETIRNSPRFEKLCADDVLLTLGYLEDKNSVPAPVEAPKEEVVAEQPVVGKPKRKPRAPKATPVTNIVSQEPPVSAVVEEVKQEPVAVPKKFKVRVVKKSNVD